MIDKLRDQYEAFPYPPRDPADEMLQLRIGSPSNINEINHYIYSGRRDLTQPFRALIAGGGTGDGLIMLAQNLTDAKCPYEIIYLDISDASLNIAKARVRKRHLENIHFFSGSLLDASQYGPFDYIDCCGVLHHLEAPQEGFKALRKSLKSDGGIGIMVYGALGRTGVYPVQDMLRAIAGDGTYQDRIDIAKRLIGQLPPTNWLLNNKEVGDYNRSDAALVDLLLNSRDRAYQVLEIADEASAAGLRLVTFIEPVRYDPTTFIDDPVLCERLKQLSWIEQCAFAETLSGDLMKHIFYCVQADNQADTIAKPDSANAIPVFHDFHASDLSHIIRQDRVLKIALSGRFIKHNLPPHTASILQQIDGKTSLQEIHRRLNGTLDWITFYQQFNELFNVLNQHNKMMIRYAAT